MKVLALYYYQLYIQNLPLELYLGPLSAKLLPSGTCSGPLRTQQPQPKLSLRHGLASVPNNCCLVTYEGRALPSD